MKTRRFYLPQLDGLRYFAFLLVFLTHLPLKGDVFSGVPLLRDLLVKVSSFGWCGVDLFLVLSSYLITNLLLLEYEKQGRISLKNFYIRRTLRIWPLYYLAITIGFFISPMLSGKFTTPEHLLVVQNHLGAYFAFLGNYSAGLLGYADSRFLAHLWTISLEEQFYLLWPLLLCVLVRDRKWLFISLFSLFGLSVYLRLCLVFTPIAHPFVWTALFTRMDPLVVGALLALYRFYGPQRGTSGLLKTGLGILLLAFVTLFPNIDTQQWYIVWQYAFVAIAFGLILDGSISEGAGFVGSLLQSRPLVWLGRLCYGLYVYHLFALNLAKKVAKHLHFLPNQEFVYLAQVVLGQLFTVIIAYVSYRFFEKYFLRLKDRFTMVPSRPD